MCSADYYKATNLAYEVLLNCDVRTLPIDLGQIVRKLSKQQIKVVLYSSLMKMHDLTYEELMEIVPSEKGFFSRNNKHKTHLICLNNFKDDETFRFTLAHELGHFFLGHLEDNKGNDKEANCFARNLLSPCPVVAAQQLFTLDRIAACCKISLSAALVRVEKFSLDCYWITSEYYSSIRNGFDCESIYSLRL